MHCSTNIRLAIVSLFIGLLSLAYCERERNAWWKQLMTKFEARDKQLTTSGSNLDETTAQTTNLPLKRNNWINSNNKNLESSTAIVSENAKTWDKSYATRRSYKSSWSSDQPFRERLVETEWDDEMPVRHVITDSWDENENQDIKTEKEQYETPNRQWFSDYRTDNEEEVVNPEKDSYNERNTNKKNQVSVNSWNIRNQLPKPERLTNNNDKWDKSSKLIDEKWSKLSSNALSNQKSKDTNRERITTTTKGYTDSVGEDFVKPVKPKLKVMFETGSIKTDKTSAKSIGNNSSISGNSSSLRSANKQFGWRSSITHANNLENNAEKQTQTPKPKASTNSYAEIQTTLRPKEPTITTIRSTTRAPQPLNFVSETISPNKKQHRIGSWVDSEGYDDPGDGDIGGYDDDWIDAPIRSQPLLDDQFYNDNVETPENLEEIHVNPPKSAAQRASVEDVAGDDGSNWRLEDALPGTPGTDYPIYGSVPRTSFDCKTHQWPGYYADVEAQCQVFHICQMGGRRDSFLCPNGTMFNQRLFVCDWWHNVQCDETATHFALNENIYDYNWESKRVSGTQTQSPQTGSAGIRRIGNEGATFKPEITTRNVATTEASTAEINASEPEEEGYNVSTDRNARSSIKYDEPVLITRSARISSPVVKFKTGKYNSQTTRRKRNH